MVNSLSVIPAQSYMAKITPREKNFNEKVFRDCQKNVRKSDIRDADWGLYAAQTCLAKALVTASPEEAKLIVAKMNFLQGIINQNMEQDQSIYSREMDDKGRLIVLKADAKSKIIPAQTEFIRTSASAATDVAKSSTNFIKEIKSPKIALPS